MYSIIRYVDDRSGAASIVATALSSRACDDDDGGDIADRGISER